MENPPSVHVSAIDTTWWRDRPVFITGCSGLLGSRLAQRLVGYGARVVGLVRDSVPDSLLFSSGTIDKIVTVRGELNDSSLIERALNEYEVKTVFHLAAQTIVGAANRNPIGTFEANIAGTWKLLEAARRTPGIEQVLFASSDKAYGAHDVLPYTESAALQGRHPYDVSKSCADLIAQCYAATYSLPVCVTRCGNLFGGGDLNWNRLVPGTIRAALEGKAPVIRSDGTMQRDYLYIEDAVDAYLKLAAAMALDGALAGRAFNIGNNHPLSVLDLVQKILWLAGREDLQPEILNQASHEIPCQYLDSSLANRVLGWQPAYALEDGLRATLDWYRNYLQENSCNSANIRNN